MITAPLVGGILLAAIGIVEFAWGVLVMFDDRFLVPRVAVVAALAPVAVWLVALVLGVQSFRPGPLAIATLFELFIAIAIAVSLRRSRTAAQTSTRRFVIGLLAGVLIIGTLAAWGLSATTVADYSGPLPDGVHH